MSVAFEITRGKLDDVGCSCTVTSTPQDYMIPGSYIVKKLSPASPPPMCMSHA